jgi:hypothetical protein
MRALSGYGTIAGKSNSLVLFPSLRRQGVEFDRDWSYHGIALNDLIPDQGCLSALFLPLVRKGTT